MGRYFARIIRAITVTTLGFGGGVGLFVFIAALIASHGKQQSLTLAFHAALVLGLAMGILLALVLFLTDLTTRLFAAKSDYHEIWDLVQTRTLNYTGNLGELTKVCREALLAVPHVKSVHDRDKYTIVASVGRSWKSPGEQMEVSIISTGPNSWTAQCTSKCHESYIAFDYTKNFENVESWLKNVHIFIKEILLA